MIQAIVKAKQSLRGKLILTLAAIVGAVALPQMIHLIGIASGVGASLGEILLPMHFFVLLAGLLAGPAVGAVTGACAPLISYLLSGMPREAVLPFMMIELIGYGLLAGLVSELRIHPFVKLVLAQLGGRVLRAGAVLIAVYGAGVSTVTVDSLRKALVSGILGILLQWCVIPLLLYRINAGGEHDE